MGYLFPLGLSVLDLGPIYATDRRQTDVRRTPSLNAPYPVGRGNNNDWCEAQLIMTFIAFRDNESTVFLHQPPDQSDMMNEWVNERKNECVSESIDCSTNLSINQSASTLTYLLTAVTCYYTAGVGYIGRRRRDAADQTQRARIHVRRQPAWLSSCPRSAQGIHCLTLVLSAPWGFRGCKNRPLHPQFSLRLPVSPPIQMQSYNSIRRWSQKLEQVGW